MEFFWILLIVLITWPIIQNRMQTLKRIQMIRRMETLRRSRVITLIHRQEMMSLFGIPFMRIITIEDSERLLRAIRATPGNMAIDLIIHTPGGLVLPSGQIAQALARRAARTTVFVPHYALSGGTLIALAADEIVMDEDAVLGPIDPQLGPFPAASILAATRVRNPNRDDKTLIMADMAAKAVTQVRETVFALLRKRMNDVQATSLAKILTDGRWTHDYPLGFDAIKKLGLPVRTDIPREVHALMGLYPEVQRRPAVEYNQDFDDFPSKPPEPPPRPKDDRAA